MTVGPTAADTASLRVGTAIHEFAPASPRVDITERYLRWFSRPEPRLSDSKFEASIYSASARKPTWFGSTLESIRASVPVAAGRPPSDGRWLSQDVANAASDFLERTADLFPGKPFIYSSQEGDLVAEFSASHGTLTSIVSPTFVLLFAVVNGVPFERKLKETRGLREEVRRFVEPLVDAHGDLAKK